MAANVREIPLLLPDLAFPPADWADCVEVQVRGYQGQARRAAEVMFLSGPGWIQRLMHLRNLLVRPLGLKHDAAELPPGQARIGFFPILHDNSDELVLGLDDRHLDFRIVVRTQANTSVRIATLIRRHNLLGRAYLFAIMPFHKLIVKASARQL